MSEGRLYVCATPIGNLGDISERLRDVLGSVDVVYAEDTRRTMKLLTHIGVTPRLRSLFTGNEMERTEQLLADVRSGSDVALVSDAGMPTISDPGAEAVRLAHEEGLVVTVVPGASAVTTALAVSGFGGSRFSFEGFLPRKGKERATSLTRIAVEDCPVVLFASPHRVGTDLQDLRESLGPDRKIAVTRELTKLYEEIWTGTLEGAVERWTHGAKGEFTLVLAPAPPREVSDADAIAQARTLVEGGVSPSDAARRVAEEWAVSRRTVYEALLDDQGRS